MPRLLALSLLALSLPAVAKDPKPTAISWRFEHVVEGYDHLNKLMVAADGREIGQSDAVRETETGRMQVTLPAGTRSLQITNYAQYEGTWEEHTVANEYSVDCVWLLPLNGKRPKKIDLVCDIDAGPTQKVR